jgi:hypothetical protein
MDRKKKENWVAEANKKKAACVKQQKGNANPSENLGIYIPNKTV